LSAYIIGVDDNIRNSFHLEISDAISEWSDQKGYNGIDIDEFPKK
jgi:hypothetical protein